jgi:hypothetical protein
MSKLAIPPRILKNDYGRRRAISPVYGPAKARGPPTILRATSQLMQLTKIEPSTKQ